MAKTEGTNMEVFQNFSERTGEPTKNFTIVDAAVSMTDFRRRGNPQKGVPAGGFPSFFVRFPATPAGNKTAEKLRDIYGVNLRQVIPKDDSKPYYSMKISERFDKFPPTTTLYSGENVVELTHAIPKYSIDERLPRTSNMSNDDTPDVKPEIINMFNANVAGIDRMILDRVEVKVNVTKNGAAYVRELKIWQKVDENGRPMSVNYGEYQKPLFLEDGEEEAPF